MDDAQWVAIGSGYEVSNLGTVRSTLRTLTQRLTRKGYPRVTLYENGARRYVVVHKLVAAAFLGPRPPGHHIAHRNGIKADNRAENLKYCTARENNLDRVAHGTMPVGECHGQAKLTANVVIEIRRFAGNTAEAARRFGISRSQAQRIRAGEAWRHLSSEAAR